MADISIINKDNTDYNVKDAAGRLALAEVENKGAKNLLQFTSASETNRNGITYDIQDGIVTLSGTPTDQSVNSYVTLKLGNTSIDPAPYCDGNHVLSGCPSGGSDDKYRLYVVRGTQYIKSDYGSGVLLDATGITNMYLVIAVYPTYYPTLAQTPLVFRPMICTKAEWDISNAFAPYAKTNRELTVALDNTLTGEILSEAEYATLVTKDKDVYFTYD